MANTALAVVADGMGGKTGGGMAAQQVVNSAAQLFNAFGADESPHSLFESFIAESHQVIRLLSLAEEKEPHSTVIAMLLTPSIFYWAHVGDSRLYHFRQGQLVQRTRDHSFVEEAVNSGKMTLAQASTHKYRNMLTHALGTEEMPGFGYAVYESPQIGDCFILCSDGLWAYFEDLELGAILDKLSVREAAELLTSLCRERAQLKGDNFTFIIVKLLVNS